MMMGRRRIMRMSIIMNMTGDAAGAAAADDDDEDEAGYEDAHYHEHD